MRIIIRSFISFLVLVFSSVHFVFGVTIFHASISFLVLLSFLCWGTIIAHTFMVLYFIYHFILGGTIFRSIILFLVVLSFIHPFHSWWYPLSFDLFVLGGTMFRLTISFNLFFYGVTIFRSSIFFLVVLSLVHSFRSRC